MHLAYQPEQFKTGPPMFCHSIYGVGQNKPDLRGIKDINNIQDFTIKDDAATKTGIDSPLFFNTGKMATN